LIRGSKDNPSPFDSVQKDLNELALQLNSVSTAIREGRPVILTGESDKSKVLKDTAARLPPAVGTMLAALAQDSAMLMQGGKRVQLNNEWTSKVLRFCQEAITDRYPFVRASKRDTTLPDFAKLFGPGGLLDSYFTANLQPMVDRSRDKWTWIDGGLGIPDTVLVQLQRAASIRDAFFPNDGKLPGASFELTPVSMDANATQFTLSLGEQVLDYRQGPLRTQAFQWPAPDGAGRARFEFVGLDSSPPAVTESGPWAWFRLLERARLQRTAQPELFNLGFTSGKLSIDLELRAASVRNPFALDDLRAFDCPERL
jgi:type VI secretion system protein ImpL